MGGTLYILWLVTLYMTEHSSRTHDANHCVYLQCDCSVTQLVQSPLSLHLLTLQRVCTLHTLCHTGALYAEGVLSIEDSSFHSNTGLGGAVLSARAVARPSYFTNTTFTANSAAVGGAWYSEVPDTGTSSSIYEVCKPTIVHFSSLTSITCTCSMLLPIVIIYMALLLLLLQTMNNHHQLCMTLQTLHASRSAAISSISQRCFCCLSAV
jgi:hypothetical protein